MSSSQQARGGGYFLSSFLAAFRQTQTSQSGSKHTTSSSSSVTQHQQSQQSSSSSQNQLSTSNSSSSRQAPSPSRRNHQGPSVTAQVSLHPRSTHGGANGASGSSSSIPIRATSRRRGSDSSSEGFREVHPAGGPWYIGGRTIAGEEKFFKLGVVRRVRSIDRLSLDKLSL